MRSLIILCFWVPTLAFAGQSGSKKKRQAPAPNPVQKAKISVPLNYFAIYDQHITLATELKEFELHSSMMNILSERLASKFKKMEMKGPRELFAFYMTYFHFSERYYGAQSVFQQMALNQYNYVTKKSDIDQKAYISGDWYRVFRTYLSSLPDEFKTDLEKVQTRNSDRYKAILFYDGRFYADNEKIRLAIENEWEKGVYYETVKKFAFVVGRLRAFLSIIKDIESEFDDNYAQVLNHTRIDITNNPCRSAEAWMHFRKLHYGDMPREQLVFIKPWLDLIQSKLKMNDFFLGSLFDTQSTMTLIPKEIIGRIYAQYRQL